MVAEIIIDGHRIGAGQACFIIAEAGVNHNGDVDLALKLIDEAAAAGADAVKFQTFSAERLVTEGAPKAAYQETDGPPESQFEMLKRLELDEAAHETLIAQCREKGVVFLSSPFDEDSAAMLVRLGVPALKVGSGELTNIGFLEVLAGFGKPLIVSTGMATLEEVDTAVSIMRDAAADFALLHCVSAYPAQPEDCNLRAIHTLAETYSVPAGWSDHTTGINVAVGAAALGAAVIEKHLTVDRSLAGPDHKASLEPAEFKAMVESIRTVEAALGDGRKEPRAVEKKIAEVARKSLVAAQDLEAGAILTDEAVAVRRPGTGLAPAKRGVIVGKRLKAAVKAGDLLRQDMFE